MTKILIVDDEKESRDIIKGVLKHARYKIEEASNGEQALEKIRKAPPDLVVLDIRMPKMDGYQVCYEIRSDIRIMNTPVIMLTVMGSTVDKITGLHLGIDDYITKPFEPEEFLVRIDSVLKRKKHYEEISMLDNLTGLYNMHFFEKQLEILINMSRRSGQAFSLSVIDVNRFESINNVHGYDVGDYVLKKIAGIMKEALRKSDIITRYEGPEFTIIFPKLNSRQADIAIKKIKDSIKAEEFISPKSGKKISVSVSTGTATWDKHIKDAMQLFDSASAQMYKKKKSKK